MDDFYKSKKGGFDNIKSSTSLIQKLMVDYCRKLNNLHFVECSTTLKGDKTVADVIKILKIHNEELDLFKNFLNILEKIPDILKKYYNIELDSVKEIITNMLKGEIFNYKQKKNNKTINVINQQSSTKSNFQLTNNIDFLQQEDLANQRDLKNLFPNIFLQNNLNIPSKNSVLINSVNCDFLGFMEKCISCIKDLLELILSYAKILLQLKSLYDRYTSQKSLSKSNNKAYKNANSNNPRFQTTKNLIFVETNNSKNNNMSNVRNNNFNDSTAPVQSKGNINNNNNNNNNNYIVPSSTSTSASLTPIKNNAPFLQNYRRNSIMTPNIILAQNLLSNNYLEASFQEEQYLEDEYSEIIEECDKLSIHAHEMLNIYGNIEYLSFSFYELILQTKEDIITLKSLFITYQSILNLDAINAISNMLCARQNIENLKIKFSTNRSFYDLKLYLFYIQFFLDNSHKINFLFETYFDNKKLQLLYSLESSNILNDFKIKNELFCFKSHHYSESYIQKCNEENIEISYFMVLFEKRKFLDIPEWDNKLLIIKNFYLSNSQMFIENDDEIGLITIFHTNGDPYKNILNEIGIIYKNMNCETKTYFAEKAKLNQHKLFLYSLSSYIFIAVKYKEKNSQESNAITEICKDLRYRFTEMHIIKTLFL